MNSRSVYNTLLLKELRESWIILLALAVLSVSGYLYSLLSLQNRWLWPLFLHGPSVIVAFWAAINGSRQKISVCIESTHLPVTRFTIWSISFCAPLCFVAALSVLLEPAMAAYNGHTHSALTLVRINYPALLALYAFSYLVSSLTATGLAAVAGASLAVLVPMIYDPSDVNFIFLAIRTGIGCGAASLMSFTLRGRRYRYRPAGRTAVLSLLVLAACVPLGRPFPHRRYPEAASDPYTCRSYTSCDGASSIEPGADDSVSGGRPANAVHFTSYRTGIRRTNAIEPHWLVIGIAGSRVYLLQGVPAAKLTRVLEWNAEANKIHTVTTLPVRPDFVRISAQGSFSSVEPGGKHLLIRLPSVRGSRFDLWLVDLRRRDAAVVLQNASLLSIHDAVWFGDEVRIPSCRSRILRVNLTARRAEYSSAVRRID